MRFLSTLVFASLVAFSTGTPLDVALLQRSNEHQNRPNVDCNVPANGLDASCWKTLGISAYLRNWTAVHMPKCAGTLHSDFASCFQNYVNGSVPNQNCSIYAPSGCAIPSDLNAKGQPISARDYYVLWNIFRIYQYYSTVWSAIAAAAPVAQGYVGHLVSTFNPPAKRNLLLDDFLQALSVAFVLIRLPAVAQLSNGGLRVADGLASGGQQAQGAARYMFPEVGTLGSQVAEWSSLADALSDMIKKYSSNMANILTEINGNATQFLAFAETGAFCNGSLAEMQITTDQILQGLMTFVISKALLANGIMVTSSEGIPPYPSPGCADATDIDDKGICGNFWLDRRGGTNVSYALNQQTNPGKTWNLTSLFKWTTGDLLMKGSRTCNNANASPRVDLSGTTVQITCLANAQWCDYNMNCKDTDCEFKNCPRQRDFFSMGQQSSDGSSYCYNLPKSYLGTLREGTMNADPC